MASETFQSLLPRILSWPEEDQAALVHASLTMRYAARRLIGFIGDANKLCCL